MSSNRTVTLYGAGGCGINLASAFAKHHEKAEYKIGYSDVVPVYLDTSRSNIGSDLPDASCFVIPEKDGSGGIRSENAGEISSHISKVIDSHKPSEFNIVLFSAAGGTGSVFGPLIARELARRNVPQVLVAVSDSESSLSALNTLNTFKTLESINRSVKKPLILSWHHNCNDTPRKIVDENVLSSIKALTILASGQNRELDSQDLMNWIYYTNPIKHLTPELSILDITEDVAYAQQIKNPISLVNLLHVMEDRPVDLNPEYIRCGYMPKDLDDGPDNGLSFIISTGEVDSLAARILSDHQQLKEIAKERAVKPESIIGEDDTVTEEGLVL